MQKKRILHLLASDKFSGAENVVCTIIENFSDEYDMAYCSPVGEIESVVNSKNISYYGLNKFNKNCLKKIIKDFNPDIIHAHDYRASILAALTYKGKIISHLHNNCPFAKGWNIKTILYNLVASKFSFVIGVSDKVFSEAIFKNKIKNKYKTIYNYVDKESIIKKANEKIDCEYDLFFIGRLTEQKEPLKFIEIVNEIKKIKKDISAVMIGDGELKADCIKLINNYNLDDTIQLVGFISNPYSIIKNSKVGIMPSKWEGFGLTAIESIILGKFVFNSGEGGLGEIFKNNKEFICENIFEYTKKILKLLEKDINKINNVDIDEFIDKKLWKEKLGNIYK